jgi:hypothetical protein
MKNRRLCAFHMRVDDLDDQGRAFLYLLPDAQTRRAAAQPRGWQRQCEVCSTAHPGRPGHSYASPAAISCNYQGRPIFSAGRPGRPGAGWRNPARAMPEVVPSSGRLRSVVLSMARSYACGLEVKMKHAIDDLLITMAGHSMNQALRGGSVRAAPSTSSATWVR